MVVFIDNVVLGTVHMHVKRGVMKEIADLVCSTGGHVDTVERTAASLYAKELVELVSRLNKDGKMPKIVVCSDQLARIPVGKSSLATADVVPISSRMSDLENIVNKLNDSFEKFKTEGMRPSFANVLGRTRLNSTQGRGVGGVGAAGGGAAAATPSASEASLPVDEGQHMQHGQVQGQGQGQGQVGGGNGPKRKNEDTENNGAFTPYQGRRPRKTNYGKSTFSMAGAEAAPIEIFIGNTNPHATPDIIKEVLVKYAENLPDKPALNVIEVKCLNNLEIDPNPRSRCWKVSVAYAQKDLMENDELYPSGWSHRKFFPPRNNKGNGAKRPHVDPVAPYLSGGATGGQRNHSM